MRRSEKAGAGNCGNFAAGVVRRLALVIAVILLLVALIPRSHLVGPDWDLYIVDQDSKPLAGITVRVYESNPTVEDAAPDIVRTTDSRGHIFLPKRMRMRAP